MSESNSPMNRGVALLHNMSVAPRTVINYKASKRRVYGTGLIFQMPDAIDSLTPAKLLALLDKQPGSKAPRRRNPVKLTPNEAEAELRARIDAHAQSLRLPPVAAVVPNAVKGDRTESDLLTVVTVLAKSSSHVYLRDKEPNLASITPGRRIILLLPPDRSEP